jgi:hypothetical protein
MADIKPEHLAKTEVRIERRLEVAVQHATISLVEKIKIEEDTHISLATLYLILPTQKSWAHFQCA